MMALTLIGALAALVVALILGAGWWALLAYLGGGWLALGLAALGLWRRHNRTDRT